jgi:mRNA-degrading endonuclease toxin of MazEF toxin-antitoxin module
MNTKMGLSIVVPLSGTPHYLKSEKLSPLMVQIVPPEGGTTKTSYSMAFQVRTVAHARFAKCLGNLSAAKLAAVVLSVQDLINY